MENKQPQAVILSMTRDGEKLCAAGGRISTQPGDAIEIWNHSQDAEKNSRLIQKVTRSGHNSVVEHACFHLAFQNVSVMVEQFMIEFRLASFTVKSRRYVDFSSAGYYMPEGLDEALTQTYATHMEALFADYQYLIEHDVSKRRCTVCAPLLLLQQFLLHTQWPRTVARIACHAFGAREPLPGSLCCSDASCWSRPVPWRPGYLRHSRQSKRRRPIRWISRIFPACRKEPGFLPHGYQFAELLASTPDAAECVARTALIESTQLPSDEVNKVLSDAKIRAEILRRVIAGSRPRALENISFTFRLNGVSLPCITHIVRHRMQSVMIPPLAQADRTHKIIPPSIRKQTECLARYEAAFHRNAALYQRLRGEGVAEETLVYFLLSGNTLDVVTTMNARELLLFLRLRTCSRAQWEIHIYADEMLRLLREKEPELFRFFGPSCFVTGNVPGRTLEHAEICRKCARAINWKESKKRPVENA